MERPIIGITCSVIPEDDDCAFRYSLHERYVGAVIAANGAPVLLPAVRDSEIIARYLKMCRGIIIPGGADTPPDLYGEDLHPKTNADQTMRVRALFEIDLTRLALVKSRPVLGICHGCQLINVAFGGSLHQHLPDVIPNALEHKYKRRHPVTIQSGSELSGVLGAGTIEVLSDHHQSVNTLGEGLKISAFAPDGVVEGVERSGTPLIIGVQWHPELSLNDEHTVKLLRNFVQACCN